jgi:hypothetical protein
MASLQFVTNVGETVQAIGIVASAFDPTSLAQIHQAVMYPTAGPMGQRLMRAGFDLESAIQDRFATEGGSKYSAGKWVGYDREPMYRLHKIKRNAGEKVGTWEGSRNPLSETFKRGNRDLLMQSDHRGFTFGSKRRYAGRFHAGGGRQPWDNIPQPARPILPENKPFGIEVARTYQNQIVQLMRTRGASLQSVRVVL